MQPLKLLASTILPSLFLLCLSDTALGQPTITVTDQNNNVIDSTHGLNYTVAAGNTTLQQLTVSVNQATSVTTTVGFAANQPTTWLRAQFPGTQPSVGPITVNVITST